MSVHDLDELSQDAKELLAMEKSQPEPSGLPDERVFARLSLTLGLAPAALSGGAAATAHAASSATANAAAHATAAATRVGILKALIASKVGVAIAAVSIGAVAGGVVAVRAVKRSAMREEIAQTIDAARVRPSVPMRTTKSPSAVTIPAPPATAPDLAQTVLAHASALPPRTASSSDGTAPTKSAAPVAPRAAAPSASTTARASATERTVAMLDALPAPLENRPAAAAPLATALPAPRGVASDSPMIGTPSVGSANPRPAQASADSLSAETALLQFAHASLLRGDPQAALSSLDAHAHDHPAGRLSEERDAMRVQVLMQLGRTAEARAAAAAFRVRYPDSLLRASVDAAIAHAP